MSNHIIDALNEHRSLLFIAPTGSGKTTLMLESLSRLDTKRVVYISPLRALNQEVSKRVIDQENANFYAMHRVCDYKNLSLDWQGLMVTSVEVYFQSDPLLFEDCLFILDEIHLFYYWGSTFRPLLLQFIELISHHQEQVWALTATASDEVREKWQHHFNDSLMINYGNHLLKKAPTRRFFAFTFLQQPSLLCSMKKPALIFCQTRAEVFSLYRKLSYLGNYTTLYCVSGRVDQFREALKRHNDQVDFIISTSTLSHGVNLPSIRTLMIFYKVKNLDMWTQMVGRAGRKNESFDLYDQDVYNTSILERVKMFFSWIVWIIRVKWKELF